MSFLRRRRPAVETTPATRRARLVESLAFAATAVAVFLPLRWLVLTGQFVHAGAMPVPGARALAIAVALVGLAMWFHEWPLVRQQVSGQRFRLAVRLGVVLFLIFWAWGGLNSTAGAIAGGRAGISLDQFVNYLTLAVLVYMLPAAISVLLYHRLVLPRLRRGG